MTISVTTPLERALARTREVLFDPFDLTKWLALGFCAFLAQLTEGPGGGLSANFSSWREPSGWAQRRHVTGWLDEHWLLALGLGSALLLLGLAIAVGLIWLQARGRFMFVDGVVRNRGAVVEPWSAYRTEAGGVFRFKLCLLALSLLALAVAGGIGLGVAWIDIDAEQFGPAAWLGLAIGGGTFCLVMVALALVDMFLDDFVVPVMYARRVGVLEGWSAVRRDLLAVYPAQVALYVLVKVLIAAVLATLVMSAVCLTFCVAACFLAIPYVGTVLLLPLSVFRRCYSLYFLDQLGGEWVLIDRPQA